MHIHIIGGGIIGLCSAYFLHQEGIEVSIIDKNDLSNGTSHGNAGMIVPSHFVPLAAPGVIAQGVKWMFNSKSPFFIRPRMSLELAQWLWQFYRACTAEKVERAMPVLYQFNEWSKHLYRKFSQLPNFEFCFEEKGLLMLYQTAHQEKEELELAEQAHELGVEAKICTAADLKNLEPNIEINALGGIFFPGDAHLYPNQFIQQLVQYLKDAGVNFITDQAVKDFKTEKGKITQILLENGKKIDIDQLLIASGSWTPKLLKKLGVNILLQDGKGYSITLSNSKTKPFIPTILSEAKVAVTPMGNDLRIGGTLEISNLSSTINKNRLTGILESVPKYYPQLEIEQPNLQEVWHGFRPCTPDGLPYIDRSKKYSNLSVAAGHGMMGMSLGPATGKLVSQMLTGQEKELDTSLFELGRF